MSSEAYGSRLGSLSIGSAPPPDAARVAAISATIDLNDATLPDTFGETARADLSSAVELLTAQAASSDQDDGSDVLRQARARLEGLNPGVLEPRRGLAGLFDSRGRRLKDFQVAFQEARDGVAQLAAGIRARGEAAMGRGGELDGLHAELQQKISELDAHIAAGLAHLAEARHGLASDAASAEAATPASIPDRLAQRLAQLVAARTAGVRRLPLARVLQNAECRAPGHLTGAAEAVAAWSDDWTQALGLQGKRPKRPRPDPEALAQGRDKVLKSLTSAEVGLAAARERRLEAASRIQRVADGAQ